jgi:hypothetical protein
MDVLLVRQARTLHRQLPREDREQGRLQGRLQAPVEQVWQVQIDV